MTQTQNYQRTISVNTSPANAFKALTKGFDHWWTSTQGLHFREVGDCIKFTFPPNTSYWIMEAKKLSPSKLVELECVEAYHIIQGKPETAQTEWLGTKMIWLIEPSGDATNIHFTHHGLTPALHCYEVCESGWNLFFNESLKAYLNTGAGLPHKE